MLCLTRPLLIASVALLCAGCAGSRQTRAQRSGSAAAVLSLDLAETRPAGEGAAFRPPPRSGMALGAPIGTLRCLKRPAVSYGAHIEMFAQNRGVVVPAGIGIAAARRCAYSLRTVETTGVIEIDRTGTSRPPTVGDFFAVWGEPLSQRRLAAFPGPVIAFVDGRRWPGDPRSIPLERHSQVVLETGSFVPPHRFYLFPPGL